MARTAQEIERAARAAVEHLQKAHKIVMADLWDAVTSISLPEPRHRLEDRVARIADELESAIAHLRYFGG